MFELTKRENPYKTRQSFSKAKNRMKTELPSSLWKQAAIIDSLASEFGYQVGPSRDNTEHLNHGKIKQFFYWKNIVYTMPGKGDKMTVWDDKGKHKLRKYYLTMYLKEACVLYLESCKNEDDKCFLSNFVISTQRLCFF